MSRPLTELNRIVRKKKLARPEAEGNWQFSRGYASKFPSPSESIRRSKTPEWNG